MVRVPAAENQVVVRDLPQNRLAAPRNNAGELLGIAARSFGQDIINVAIDMDQVEQMVETAGAKQLDLEFSAFERETLYNPETGFMNMQGGNALNNRKATEDALAKKRAEIMAKARSPRQRAILSEILDRRQETALLTMARHAAGEGRRYADDTGKARIANEIENAIAKRDDPDGLGAALDTIKDEVDAWAARNGASPEARDMERRTQLGKAHAGIVDTLANDDPEVAQAWLEGHKDEMLTAEYEKLTDGLKPAVIKRKAMRIADEVRGVAALGVRNMPRDDDLNARLAAVDKMNLNPELEAAVKQQVRSGVALDQQLLSDQRTRAAESAWEHVEAGRAVPPSLLAQVSPSVRRALTSASAENGGFSKRSDPTVWNNALDMAAYEPERFAQIDLNEVRGEFSRSEWQRLMDMQRQIKAGKDPKALPMSRIISATRDIAEAAGLTTTGKKGKTREAAAERISAFRDALRADVETYTSSNNGSLPDDDTVRDMARRQLTKLQVWDDEALVFRDQGKMLYFERGKRKPGTELRFNPDDVAVPDRFRDRYTQRYRELNGGRLPPEGDLVRAWLAIGNR
jgi:hypothetical protein